jgi:hypothetical protein
VGPGSAEQRYTLHRVRDTKVDYSSKNVTVSATLARVVR